MTYFRSGQTCVGVLISLFTLIFIGCGSNDLDTTYGKRRGLAKSSVNGTSVLADMFQSRGNSVNTWKRLSPRLQKSSTIVWVPDSFELPSAAEIDYLESWLEAKPNRTLIYVGRDYDGAIPYWKQLANRSNGKEFIHCRREAAKEQAEHAARRSYTTRDDECDWFRMKNRDGFKDLLPAGGQWAEEIGLNDLELVAAGQLVPTGSDSYRKEILIDSADTPYLVKLTRARWDSSKVIVALNGSALLNLPLVNHSHRQLAGHIIDQCDSQGLVTFLESNPSGLVISERDPTAFTGLEPFKQWPLQPILMHVIVFGAIYLLSVFPIFGRPRRSPAIRSTTFTTHVTATAEWFAFTDDRDKALDYVRQYQQRQSDPLRH